ncbi:MAG: hypothetical protein WD045_01800 [Pirellulaceae bacterium]
MPRSQFLWIGLLLSTYEINDGAIVGPHAVSLVMDDPQAKPPGKLPADYTLEVTRGNNTFELELEP